MAVPVFMMQPNEPAAFQPASRSLNLIAWKDTWSDKSLSKNSSAACYTSHCSTQSKTPTTISTIEIIPPKKCNNERKNYDQNKDELLLYLKDMSEYSF